MERPRRVFVVDDSPDLRDLLGALFEIDPRFTVAGEAESIREVAELLDATQADAVILDLTLPDGSGADAVRRVTDLLPGLPIVVLSGHQEARLAEEVRAAGAAAYVEKGRDLDELLDALERAIDDRPATSATTDDTGEPAAAPLDADEVLARISHDLKTPITVIGGMARLLASPGGLDEATQTRCLDAVVRNADTLQRMLDLLTLARHLGLGRVEPDVAPVDLGALVAEILGDLDEPAASRFTLDVTEPTAALADRALTSVALDALLDNVVKHTPDDAPARVRVGPGPVVVIEDAGPGIEPAQIDRMFERFDRLDRPGSGFGLGAFVAREIARLQGGEVVAESGPDGGLVVTVTVPGG